jgi:hypothetical protein
MPIHTIVRSRRSDALSTAWSCSSVGLQHHPEAVSPRHPRGRVPVRGVPTDVAERGEPQLRDSPVGVLGGAIARG